MWLSSEVVGYYKKEGDGRRRRKRRGEGGVGGGRKGGGEKGEWVECDKEMMTTSWARRFEEIVAVFIYSVDIFRLLPLVKGKNSI